MIFVFDGGLGWGLVFGGTWYVRRTVQYLNIEGARKVIYINKKKKKELTKTLLMLLSLHIHLLYGMI